MNNLQRKNKTYKLHELPKIKSNSFTWNGQSGYTGSMFRRSINASLHVYKHFGVFYGFDESNILWVLENNQDGVECVTFDDFMAGNSFFTVEFSESDPSTGIKVLKRAQERVDLYYDSDKNNCEHFAKYCVWGIAESKQVEGTRLFVNVLLTIPEMVMVLRSEKELFSALLQTVDSMRESLDIPRTPQSQKFIDDRMKIMGVEKKNAFKRKIIPGKQNDG